MWENTVSLAMQNGGTDGATVEVTQVAVDDEDQQDGVRDIDPLGGDVDLTEPVIQEASLLDHEGEELGEVEPPSIRTEDSKSHGKRRGGHAPKGAGASRSR